MNVLADDRKAVADIDTLISEQAQELSALLQDHRLKLFPPAAEKPLRSFQIGEAASCCGSKTDISVICRWKGRGRFRLLPPADADSFTAEQIQELRFYLDETGHASQRYVPHRRNQEHVQVIAVVNFKGGSGKTTTTAHLGQHLALTGHRVLMVDLDPQASLSVLCTDFSRNLTSVSNETLYGAIRYDEEARPLTLNSFGKTNFPGLHIIPANIELMEFEYDTPRILATRAGEAKAG